MLTAGLLRNKIADIWNEGVEHEILLFANDTSLLFEVKIHNYSYNDVNNAILMV